MRNLQAGITLRPWIGDGANADSDSQSYWSLPQSLDGSLDPVSMLRTGKGRGASCTLRTSKKREKKIKKQRSLRPYHPKRARSSLKK